MVAVLRLKHPVIREFLKMGKILTLRIDPETLKLLDKMAKQRGITRSELLREAIDNILIPKTPSPLSSSSYYGDYFELKERIAKLEGIVQALMAGRPLNVLRNQPNSDFSPTPRGSKTVVIEQSVTKRAELHIPTINPNKDSSLFEEFVKDNPWGEVLRNKSKGGSK